MNRRELILYLENLKNLEILKYRAIQQTKLYDDKIAEEREKIKEKECYSFATSTIVCLIVSICLICASIGVRYYSFVYSQDYHLPFVLFCLKFAIPIFFVVLAITVMACGEAFSDFFWTIRSNTKAKKHNQYVKQIESQVIKKIREISNKKEEIKADVLEIDKLLAEAYSFNLIPSQFRTLPYIIYIYDYVSTSQQTLENAFLHSHIEQAVKQITAKLDIIISQNIQIIRLLKVNLLATYANTSQTTALANDVKLNNHLVSANNFYMRSKLL